MLTRLFLLLCLTQYVFSTEPPVVDCMVVHLKYVHCTWTNTIPPVNYTFYIWSKNVRNFIECTAYLSENGVNTGCDYHYGGSTTFHFNPFRTKLVHGNSGYETEHDLRTKVKLNPPVNLTAQNGTDGNLWFYWNQTLPGCVQSEVQYRANNFDWRNSLVGDGKQSFCIILPSSNSRYELKVRSKIAKSCGESLWSDWSDPVVWGSNNSTDTNQVKDSITVWTPVLYVMGIIILILLVMMLLHHERLRIILVPVLPKPSLVPRDIEDWAQVSKVLKENFKPNFNERTCPVREYCHVAQSDSESSDSSTFSVTTDQTDCSVSIPVESELSNSCSLSTSTAPVSPEEEGEQVSV